MALARRLVRAGAIEQVRGDLHSIDYGHVEAVLELARQVEGSGRLQVPQVDVYRSFDWIRFAPLPVGDQLLRRNQEVVCTKRPERRNWPKRVVVRIDLSVARSD